MHVRERQGESSGLPEYRSVYFQHLLTTALNYYLERNQNPQALEDIEILGVQEFHRRWLVFNRPELCTASEVAVLNHFLYGITARHKSSEEKPFLVGVTDQNLVVPMKQPNFYLESCGYCGDYVFYDYDGRNCRENVSKSMEWTKKKEREEHLRMVELCAHLFRAFEQPGVFRGSGRIRMVANFLPDTYSTYELTDNGGSIVEWHFGHK